MPSTSAPATTVHPAQPSPGEVDLPAPQSVSGAELLSAACSDLLADGWREYPDQFKRYARSFYKRHETPTRCHGNNDKPGIQICVSVSEGYAGGVSLELDLCAGLKDETWLKLQNYALPKTVKEVTALIPRMLAMWEAANAFDTLSGGAGSIPVQSAKPIKTDEASSDPGGWAGGVMGAHLKISTRDHP